MQIFALSRNPKRAAQFHGDRHVVKMILETAQLLSCALHMLLDPAVVESLGLYRKTHVNHPSARWVRRHPENYKWTVRLGLELCAEYTRRYKRTHKTEALLKRISKVTPTKWDTDAEYAKDTMTAPFIRKGTPLPLAFKDPRCYVRTSAVKSYRRYYLSAAKCNLAVYNHSTRPEWIN